VGIGEKREAQERGARVFGEREIELSGIY